MSSAGDILVGGGFTRIAGVSRPYLARLLTDGSPDPTFRPPAGPDNNVFTITEQPFGHLVVGGWFNRVDGIPVGYVAGLNPNGTLDRSFSVFPGANDYVMASTLLPNGDVVVGGSFSLLQGVPRNGLAQLVGGAGPCLGITPLPNSQFALSWLTNHAEDFVLQQAAGLATSTWDDDTNVISTVGKSRSVIVPGLSGQRFYRLHKP